MDNIIFHRMSTVNYEYLDTFTIPNVVNQVENFTSDPGDRYLYLINRDDLFSAKTYNRTLIIIDVASKAVVKQIPLQVDVILDERENLAIPCIIPTGDRVFLWDHYGAWCIETGSWDITYGKMHEEHRAIYNYTNPSIQGVYDEERNVVIVADMSYEYEVSPDFLPYPGARIFEFDADTGEVIRETALPEGEYTSRIFFSGDKEKVYLLGYFRNNFYAVNLTSSWHDPPRINTRTNYLQYSPGDRLKFKLNISNGYVSQNVTAYIYLCIPGGNCLFFAGKGLTYEVSGIPLSLPEDLDIDFELMSFILPEGLPGGLYNFNALMTNENYEIGPMGTWNFYMGN